MVDGKPSSTWRKRPSKGEDVSVPPADPRTPGRVGAVDTVLTLFDGLAPPGRERAVRGDVGPHVSQGAHPSRPGPGAPRAVALGAWALPGGGLAGQAALSLPSVSSSLSCSWAVSPEDLQGPWWLGGCTGQQAPALMPSQDPCRWPTCPSYLPQELV